MSKPTCPRPLIPPSTRHLFSLAPLPRQLQTHTDPGGWERTQNKTSDVVTCRSDLEKAHESQTDPTCLWEMIRHNCCPRAPLADHGTPASVRTRPLPGATTWCTHTRELATTPKRPPGHSLWNQQSTRTTAFALRQDDDLVSAPAPPSASAWWLWDGTPKSASLGLLVMFQERKQRQREEKGAVAASRLHPSGSSGTWCPSSKHPCRWARPRTASPLLSSPLTAWGF